MAEHTAHAAHSHGIEEHRRFYGNFVRGACALSLHCAYILVALCSFEFGHTWAIFLGWAAIILGAVFIAIDLSSGSRRFLLSIGGLIVFGLITAINIS